MNTWQLAQLNIAHLRAPLESPLLTDFVQNLDRINQLAETSPGFIWRLQTDDGNATAIRPFGDEYVVNLSVWSDIDALRAFVFRSDHVEILRRRREWFGAMDEPYSVLWWIASGRLPSEAEARDRLTMLREHGATPDAFTFRQSFPAPANASSAL